RSGPCRPHRELRSARGQRHRGISTSVNMMEPKRLGLLRELAPGVALVGALVNPNLAPAVRQARDIEEAARAIGQRIVVAKASTDDELEGAIREGRRPGDC